MARAKNTYALKTADETFHVGLTYASAVSIRNGLILEHEGVVLIAELTGEEIRLGAPFKDDRRDVLRRLRLNEEEWQTIIDGARIANDNAARTASTIVDAMRLGAVDYLGKPFEEGELEAALDRALEFKTLERERDRDFRLHEGPFGDHLGGRRGTKDRRGARAVAAALANAADREHRRGNRERDGAGSGASAEHAHGYGPFATFTVCDVKRAPSSA